MLDLENFRLSHSGALGSYEDREEYQVERTIVWIMIPEGLSRSACLSEGDRLFGPVWNRIPDVLMLARQASRQANPEFWRVHDLTQTAEAVLAVWGIWLDPDTGGASYQVGNSYEFSSEHPERPEVPEEEQVMVERSADGRLTLSPSNY